MNRRNAMLFGLVLACPAVATYLASCHCGPPADVGAPGAQRSAPVSSPEPRASASGARDGAEAVPPLGAPILRRASEGRRGGEGELRSFRSALTSSATSDTDFLTANRGYGIVEDTSVSAGNIRRTLGLPNFGLANVNPTVDGWQTTTALPVSRGAHAVVTSNGYACLVGGGNGAGLYQDVYCAMINADGTLKQWMQTTGIPGKRSGVSGIVHVGKMYFTGGADGTNYLDEVVYAPLNSDGTITQWFSTNSFPTRRYWHATVAYNGYLYVIGGTGSSGYLNSIEYAKIDAGGATGQWLAATSFSNAREALSAVVVNGYLYVLGGYNGSRLSDVQYAKINADGSLGSFASAGSFPTARFGHTSVAYDGRLYVLGGDVGGETNNVSFAQINADGTVGLWSTSVAFSSPRYAHATFVSTGFIYVVGGKAGSNYLSDVQFAPIRPDGHVGTTWVKGTDLPTKKNGSSSAIYNGFIYSIGGHTGSKVLDEVAYAPVFPDGTVGQWKQTTPFPGARACHNSMAANGFIYVVGGNGSGCDPSGGLSDVQYTAIQADGSVGAWSATTSMPATIQSFEIVTYNGYMYAVGGYRPYATLSDVVFSKMNPDGSLGSWSTTTGLPVDRSYHSVVVHNGNMYVIGGIRDPSGTYLDAVSFAPINADGTLGNWSSTTSMPSPRRGQISAVVNGYLYAIGGYDGTKTLNDVLVAKINSDGTVGSWASTTPSPISNWWAAGGIYNGHVIVGGGWDGTNRISDVFAAPINANGTVGEWKGTASLPTAQNFHAGAYSNGFVYAIGGCTNVACSAMTDEVKFAPVNADGTVGTWNAGAALPTAKWSFAASAYNRYVYVIGGCTKSNCSNVLKEVHYAPVQGNGAITSWTPAPDFPKPIHAHNMMAYNDYLYVIGGISTSGPYLDDVYYSRINQDGSLGQWNTSQKFAIARGLHTSTLFAGNLYLIGGGDSAIGYKDDVQYAPINADGTVGAWNMSSTHLPNTLAGLASVAANGYLIATGGYNAGGYASGVWATPVKPAGDIGSFPTASSLLTQKAGHSSVFYSGYLYVIGGSNQTNAFADVQFAPVTAYSTSTKSTFSKQFDLGSVEVIHSIELKGVLGGVNSSFDLSYRIAGDDAVYGNWSAPVSLTSVPGAVVVGVVGRYIEVAVTINDNGRLGVTSGMGSSELSELSVSYGEEPDGGMTDGGDAATDGGVDAESDGGQDGGMSDAGSDTGQVTGDGGEDAGEPDSGVTDTGAQDAGDMDAAFDSGSDTSFDGAQDGSHPSDASDDGAADTGVPDDGAQDTGGMDAGTDASEKPAAEEEIPQNMYSCSCSTLALAQDTPWVEPAKEEKKQSMSVAVFQFEAQGADKKIPVILTDTVLSMLNRLPDTRVIGSKEIDAMLNYEQKKQMTGCNDASCAVALGGALGVDKILMGSVGRLGETHILDMKLIDIRTAHIDTSYNKRLESGREEEFLDVLPEALTVLFPWAEGTWAKTTSASQKPEAKSQKAEAKSQKAGVLAHAGMFGLSLRGYADLKFTGGAGDLSAGYFFADWFEASLGVGYGAHAMLKPRLTFLLYNLDGSVKPYLTAHGLAFFSDPVALGAGVGPGIQFEFDGHWGLFLETPIEYFFVSPEIADAWVVLVALGVQLRI